MDFLVRRNDLKTYRFVDEPEAEPEAGEVSLAIDRFAFTANNVTYGVFGDTMSYWDFFPAEQGWGRIPVWGFADVTASRHPKVKEGERFYGYFPMSTQVTLRPDRVTGAGFADGADHRGHLHAIYNQYTRVAADPGYDPKREAEQALLRPLFATAFLLDDLFAEQSFYGAEAVAVTSASSKTSICTAFLLAARKGVEVVGLTSARNVAFVSGLGCYGEVVSYDALDRLAKNRAMAIIDVAGDQGVLHSTYRRVGAALKHVCLVGATHWQAPPSEEPMGGLAPEFFFAPSQLEKRVQEWGPDGFQARLGERWSELVEWVGAWLEVSEGRGPGEVERAYLDVLAGRTRPERGQMLSLDSRES